jgi:hypothetical protein
LLSRPEPKPEAAKTSQEQLSDSLQDTLGDLAAAVHGEPQPEAPSLEAPAAESSDSDNGLSDLAAALESANGEPATSSPAPTAAPKPQGATRARPRGPQVASAQPIEDEDGQPQKRRDMLPLIISGSALLLLLIVGGAVTGAFIFGNRGKRKSEPQTQSVRLPNEEDLEARYSSGDQDFFGKIPPGRTSEDYKREQEEKKKQNQP